MTIDEADTILSCERLDSSMRCGASDEDIDEALRVAINIMRKYQKIEEIMNREYGLIDMKYCLPQKLADIREVLEDGSN